jgi:hypothetical protein
MRYEMQTYLATQEVLQAALSFFGVDLGLDLQSQGPSSLHFVGGGGHVTLTVQTAADSEPVTVVFETREWDAQVEEFMAHQSRKRWWRRIWNSVKGELA